MDARITKQRLGNFLSYDWLKILGVIVAAVAVLYVFFLIITTRPTVGQVYSVFTYGGLKVGEDSTSLADDLVGKFSYGILETDVQTFAEGTMGEQAMAARRGMLEGDAVFAADHTDEENTDTPFARLCGAYAYYGEGDKLEGFYNIPAFLQETETYLTSYFGGTLAGEPDAEKLSESFARVSESDKRFKTDAQRAAGLAEERARILALRDNYLAVKAAFDDGTLSTVDYVITSESGEEERYPFGVNLRNLTKINNLFYYYEGESVSVNELVLLFFDNGDHVRDMKYENLAFVRYLLDTYAPVHS